MRTLFTSVFLAAAVAAPAIASTDGTAGPTSTGSFNVSAAISPNPTPEVLVLGLADFSFSGTEGGTIDSQQATFCLLREGGGEVGLTISSFDPADTYFRVKTAGGANEIQMLLHVTTPGTSSTQMTEGEESVFSVLSTCGAFEANDLSLMSISLLNTSTAVAGNYANSFLVTVVPK